MNKSTAMNFNIFIRDNKTKLKNQYPFLSQDQIMSKLRLQWRKINNTNQAITKCRSSAQSLPTKSWNLGKTCFKSDRPRAKYHPLEILRVDAMPQQIPDVLEETAVFQNEDVEEVESPYLSAKCAIDKLNNWSNEKGCHMTTYNSKSQLDDTWSSIYPPGSKSRSSSKAATLSMKSYGSFEHPPKSTGILKTPCKKVLKAKQAKVSFGHKLNAVNKDMYEFDNLDANTEMHITEKIKYHDLSPRCSELPPKTEKYLQSSTKEKPCDGNALEVMRSHTKQNKQCQGTKANHTKDQRSQQKKQGPLRKSPSNKIVGTPVRLSKRLSNTPSKANDIIKFSKTTEEASTSSRDVRRKCEENSDTATHHRNLRSTPARESFLKIQLRKDDEPSSTTKQLRNNYQKRFGKVKSSKSSHLTRKQLKEKLRSVSKLNDVSKPRQSKISLTKSEHQNKESFKPKGKLALAKSNVSRVSGHSSFTGKQLEADWSETDKSTRVKESTIVYRFDEDGFEDDLNQGSYSADEDNMTINDDATAANVLVAASETPNLQALEDAKEPSESKLYKTSKANGENKSKESITARRRLDLAKSNGGRVSQHSSCKGKELQADWNKTEESTEVKESRIVYTFDEDDLNQDNCSGDEDSMIDRDDPKAANVLGVTSKKNPSDLPAGQETKEPEEIKVYKDVQKLFQTPNKYTSTRNNDTIENLTKSSCKRDISETKVLTTRTPLRERTSKCQQKDKQTSGQVSRDDQSNSATKTNTPNKPTRRVTTNIKRKPNQDSVACPTDEDVSLSEGDEGEEEHGAFFSNVATETNAALLHALMKLKAKGSSQELSLEAANSQLSSPDTQKSFCEEDLSKVHVSELFQDPSPPLQTSSITPARRRLVVSGNEATTSNFGAMFDDQDIFL